MQPTNMVIRMAEVAPQICAALTAGSAKPALGVQCADQELVQQLQE
jgi:hypothetical protein